VQNSGATAFKFPFAVEQEAVLKNRAALIRSDRQNIARLSVYRKGLLLFLV
jgi:hypothetical protein